MNILPIALCLIAIKAMGKGNLNGNMGNITNLLNDDAKSIVNSIGTLTDKNSTDKTGALLNVITNPAVIALASNIFGKNSSNQSQNGNSRADDNQYNTVNEDHQPYENSSDNSTDTSSPDITDSSNPINGDNNQRKSVTVEDNNIVDYEGASREAVSFFRPVSNIAGQEVSAKLYKVYDNWYSQKAN